MNLLYDLLELILAILFIYFVYVVVKRIKQKNDKMAFGNTKQKKDSNNKDIKS